MQKLGGIVSYALLTPILYDGRTHSTFRTANPTYTVEELVYQLRLIKARLLIVHPWGLHVALEAARICGIPGGHIILFDPVADSPYDNMQDLVKFGLGQVQQFTPLRLPRAGAKTKLAFLSFSSGTTGRPKVSSLQHVSHTPGTDFIWSTGHSGSHDHSLRNHLQRGADREIFELE